MNTHRAKTIFWASVGLLGVAFIVLVCLSLEAVGLALGHRDWGGRGGATALPCLVAAAAIVTAAFRRWGLLEGERVLETLRRSPDAGPVPLEAAVEVRTPRSTWLGLALMMAVIAVIVLAAVLVLPAVPDTRPSGYGVAAFFALFSLGPWYGYATRAGLVARVDREGVRGDNAVPKASALWGEIASCEVMAVPQPWGQFTRYTFRDGEDKPLIRLMLTSDGAEQGRFQSAVRECFG